MSFEILIFHILGLSHLHLLSSPRPQPHKSFEKLYLVFVIVFLVIPLCCHNWAASYSHHVLNQLLFFCEICVKTDCLISFLSVFLSVPRSNCLMYWRLAARNNKIIDYKNTITFSPVYCVWWSFKWPQWVEFSVFTCIHWVETCRVIHSPLSLSLPCFMRKSLETFFQLWQCLSSCLLEFSCDHCIWVIFIFSLHIESIVCYTWG